MTAVAIHICFGHVNAVALTLFCIWFGHVTAVKLRYIAANWRYFGHMNETVYWQHVSSFYVMFCNSLFDHHCQRSVSAGSVIIMQYMSELCRFQLYALCVSMGACINGFSLHEYKFIIKSKTETSDVIAKIYHWYKLCRQDLIFTETTIDFRVFLTSSLT